MEDQHYNGDIWNREAFALLKKFRVELELAIMIWMLKEKTERKWVLILL